MTTRPPGLVSLTGAGARFFIWAYYAATVALAAWTLADSTIPALVGVTLALYAVVCVGLSRDRGERLSLPVAIAGAAVGPVSALILCWQLVPGGYTAWYIGAATAMLFLVNLRGRIMLAWIGCALLVGVLLWWGATTSTGIEDAVLISTRQSAILAIGTLTAVGLRRTGARIRDLVSEASVRGAAEAAGRAVVEERQRRMSDLRTSIVPLLERIEAGAPLTDEDKSEFAVAEAELRDSLRARGLLVPIVTEAARDARRRGVDVVLLDDSGAGAIDPELHEFAAVVAETLRESTDGRVTARLLPPGRPVLGTVVADGSTYRKLEVARSDS